MKEMLGLKNYFFTSGSRMEISHNKTQSGVGKFARKFAHKFAEFCTKFFTQICTYYGHID